MTIIDPHVHFRDEGWAYKCTIKDGYRRCRAQNIDVFCDMPNTNPPITTIERVEKRRRIARYVGCNDGYYLWIGITTDVNQIKEAVRTVKKIPEVVGIKKFAGYSTGNLGIAELHDQLFVYQKLVEFDYDGVLAVHCEKESLTNTELFNPEKPYTWNLARPVIAELTSIDDQINLAIQTGFKGTLYILHVTNPLSVEKIWEAKNRIKIISEVTPHHLSKSTNDMQTPDSLIYKCNPPIRDEVTRAELMECLRKGMIDIIGTDFAPHTLEEKMKYPYPSGTTWSLENYRSFIESLYNSGISESRIHELTYGNAKKHFVKIIE